MKRIPFGPVSFELSIVVTIVDLPISQLELLILLYGVALRKTYTPYVKGQA